MVLRYQVSTGPNDSLVTVANVKQQLYIDIDDDDDLLQRLINTAEKFIGDLTQRALPPQSITYYLDGFPSDGVIRLPVSPVRSITSITYKDENSASQTYTVYQSDLVSEPARIMPALNGAFPSTDNSLSNVVIVFAAGYTDLQTMRYRKQELEHAVMLLVGLWYENREAATDMQLYDLPAGLQNLISMASVATEY